MHLNLYTYTPRQLLIRARNRSDVCSRNRPNPRKATRKQRESDSHVKAESEHRSSKRRPIFTGAEVEVLLQNVDVSILFYYRSIPGTEFRFIYSLPFAVFVYITFSHLADIFVQSDVQ